jgi:hypothetical protein
MDRRRFLVGMAGGGLAAIVGRSAFALDLAAAISVAPWREARAIGARDGDPRLFVVSHAILAPNPHNRQPWIVELSRGREMVLWCDLDRRLPETDPFDRQIVIGLGAFTELASLAASQIGLRLEVIPFPDGEPRPRLDRRPIAHLRLIAKEQPEHDPLFAAIGARRSTKRPFDVSRPVPADAAARLASLSNEATTVATVTGPAEVERLRALTWAAWLTEFETSRTWMESVDLMRFGQAEIDANPDGISIGGPGLEPLVANGTLSRTAFADPRSAANRVGRERYQAMLAATPAYLTVTAAQNSRAGELETGRAYARANLLATTLGLALQPVSQALQEYPEMAGHRAELDRLLGVAPGRRLHMLARLGYGPPVPETPRWAAETRLRTG